VDATPLEELLELLDLELVSDDTYLGPMSANASQSVYGGQIASQALLAAGRTVLEDQQVHSLHAYFIHRADPAIPITYQVSRVRDGRIFTSRHVSAIQGKRVSLVLLASFHRVERGLVHQDPMPEVADPESLPTYPERLAAAFDQPVMPIRQPFDIRYTGPLSFEAARQPSLRTNKNLVWLRADGDLPPHQSYQAGNGAGRGQAVPSEGLLHACLLTYISDITLLDTVMLNHGLMWGHDVASGASLDHSMWFHRPFRVDEWLLYAQETPVAYGARVMVRGQIFTREGQLVASVVQEGLLRLANLDRAEQR